MTPRWRLFTKYFALVTALVSLALLASGGIGLWFSYKETEAQLVALQREKAAAAATRIELYIKDIEHQLGWTALPQAAPGGSAIDQRRFEYLRLLRQAPAITEVAWIDAHGREQLRVSRLAMDAVASNADFSREPKFTAARSGKTYFSPVYFRKETEPYMTIARSAGGAVGGVTAAEVNLKFVWEVITQIRIGRAGLAYVVNSDGTLIAHPDISLVLQKTDLNRLTQVAAAKAGAGDSESESSIARDLKGAEVLTAHAPIPTLGWNVFVELPLAEAFAPVYASLTRTGLLLLLGLALSVIASVFLARRMVQPIRLLQAGAARIGAGTLDQRIEVRSGDELEALAEQFNRMAAQLKESYAGLERKVEERTRDLTEALEQQTATAEILQVISGSPTDVQPVFDTIARRAATLSGARVAVVSRFDGELIHLVAIHGATAQAVEAVRGFYPTKPGGGTLTARIIRDRVPAQIPDLLADPEFAQKEGAKVSGIGGNMGVPMLLEGRVIGAIVIARAETGPFPEKQVALLKTFAEQAVIAIENVRLFKELEARNAELAESLQHQTATSEVLRIVSGSVSDAKPVFDAILASILRLFAGFDASIWLVDGDWERPIVHGGPTSPETLPPLPIRYSGPQQVILRRKVLRVEDFASDVSLSEEERQLYLSFSRRSMIRAPLLREGEGIGMLSVSSTEPGRFTDKQVKLLETFAQQAVIAMENARLFKELEARNRDLTEALEQQTATAEILRVISGSPTDAQPVFDTIAKNAAALCDSLFANVFRFDGEQLHWVASNPLAPAAVENLRQTYPVPPGVSTLSGRVILTKAVVELEDALADPDYNRGFAVAGGFRRMLGVPMLREGNSIGAVCVGWGEPGPVSKRHVDLLKTFADQAVIAIENVRLFKELEARNRDLSEALEQQRATSEVLEAISSTSFDLKSVLQTLMDNASRLCGADQGTLFRPDGSGNFYPSVHFGYDAAPEALEQLAREPIRAGRDSATGRAILERRAVHIPDVRADTEYERRDLQGTLGYGTLLAVPMLRDGESIGVITMTRGPEPKPFTAKQVSLVATFADQAVIAIENVRLFNEIQDKSRELEVANRHKSEFLANMSHELRTPLNAIIGFSEVLIERMFGELNDKQIEYLKDIHSSGHHLLSLINDILDLSKIEAGRTELELSHFDLAQALANSLTLVRERASRHGIKLALESGADVGEWTADERKFKQIMLNLLSNAVKFTPPGGSISVRAWRTDGAVNVAVADTGIGIAERDRELVFQEFRQVRGNHLQKAEGTGLGLALTRKFVELHGGTITLESEVGRGSTFTFTLPEKILEAAA